MFKVIVYYDLMLIDFHELKKYHLEFFKFLNRLIQSFEELKYYYYFILPLVVVKETLSTHLIMKLQDLCQLIISILNFLLLIYL